MFRIRLKINHRQCFHRFLPFRGHSLWLVSKQLTYSGHPSRSSSCHLNKNPIALDLYWIGFQIYKNWCRQSLARADIEPTTMQRAFDHAVNYKALFQAFLFMRAHYITGKEPFFCVVDRIAMAIVLPSNQIFFVDICGFTSVNPLGHWCVGLHLSRASRNFSFSPSYIEILVCGYGKLPAVTSLWNLPRAATRSSWICLCKRPTWPKA